MLRLSLTTAILSPVLLSLAAAQERGDALELREKWSNLFADAKVVFHVAAKVPGGKGTVTWTFADAATKRVFPQGRGEKPVESGAVKMPLLTPHVKPGVVLKAELTVSVHVAGKNKPVAVKENTLWIFPADPFFNRMKWLEGLKITVFDPDRKNQTVQALKRLKVPFDQAGSAAALAEVREGLVLVGEGVSFREESGLAEILFQAAARGVPVLCLAPAAGSFPVPGTDNDFPSPASLAIKRQDVIRTLDKRLDAVAWAPDNEITASSLALKAEEGKVIGDVVTGSKGWPWLQLDYPDKRSRLIVCGFAIIRKWDAGPTPRFLLARLLEHVTALNASSN
jgi:hypothetical protein